MPCFRIHAMLINFKTLVWYGFTQHEELEAVGAFVLKNGHNSHQIFKNKKIRIPSPYFPYKNSKKLLVFDSTKRIWLISILTYQIIKLKHDKNI